MEMRRWITAALCCILLLTVCGTVSANQDFTFAEGTYSVFEGENLQLELLRQGDFQDAEVTWKSSSQKIAAVNSEGLVTGKAKGDATITASCNVNGKSYSAKVTIHVLRPVTEISLNEKDLTIFSPTDPLIAERLTYVFENPEDGESMPVLLIYVDHDTDLSISVLPKDASDRHYTLAVEDEELVKVNGKTLSANAVGETILTVASQSNPEVAVRYHLYCVQRPRYINVNLDKTIGIGRTAQAEAVFTPEDATIQDVIWSTSTPKIISVSETGVITGLAKGTGKVRATTRDGSGKTAEASISVQQLPESITLTCKRSTLFVGNRVNISASVHPSSASNKNVEWTSSDPSIATVNQEGRVTGKSRGTVTITCSSKADPTVTAQITLSVIQEVTAIKPESKNVNVPVGGQVRLGWTVEPEDADNKDVTFSSSSTKYATVDADGTVHGVARGESTITIKAIDGSGQIARVKVNVVQLAAGVHMEKEEYVLDPDESITITAVFEPSNTSNKNMTWTSSDEHVATVSGKTNYPHVHGKAWGEATITGVSEDGGFVTSCVVRVGTYRKALTITDLYLDNNKPKLVIRNNSNMNITRINFTIELRDDNDEPIICTTDGKSVFSGYYKDTLGEGRSTRHGHFTFQKYEQPATKVGLIVLTITGYRCDDGFSYTYRDTDAPYMTWTSDDFIPITFIWNP